MDTATISLSAAAQPAHNRPLCVDLDGTLVATDLLWESLMLMIRHRPLAVAALPFQALWGSAVLKRFIATRVQLNPSSLPYNAAFLHWLRAQRSNGRQLILATASDEVLARRVAAECDLFDDVIASDGVRNLKGRAKLDALQQRFTEGFDYAGNSSADRPIWERAISAVAVNVSPQIQRELTTSLKLEATFSRTRRSLLASSIKALRIHQWSKNLLVFIPAITSHQIAGPILQDLLILFFGFSLTASALYIVNDLLDLEADRKHPQKSSRPFASGDLSIQSGIVAVPLLLAASVYLILLLGSRLLIPMLVYALGSGTYSYCLKMKVPLDVFILSIFYVLRIVAGGMAAEIPLTSWLLVFAMFFFLSMACCKRVAELVFLRRSDPAQVAGRGYSGMDMEQINVFGVCAAFTSSVILTLYIDSEHVRLLYREPFYLWSLVPLFLYWQTRVWTLTWRGYMDQDPVVFAIKDRVGYIIILLTILVMVVAKFDILSRLTQ